MEELLEKLAELTEEEKMEVLQLLENKKPSIDISKATFYDCCRPDGLNLNIDHATTLHTPTLRIPSDFPTPVPSARLCEHLERIKSVWVVNNKKSCRMIIDAILTEVLLNEANERLSGYCGVKNNWEGGEYRYTGDVDYMLGYSRIKSVDTMDSSFIVVQAGKEWPQSAVPLVICQAGCLLKRRPAAGKNTPVLAALTNGFDYRFFAIDIDGTVYASEKEYLERGKDGTFNSSSSLSEILRWFIWLMASIESIARHASNETMAETMIDDSLSQLRSCFGPKSGARK